MTAGREKEWKDMLRKLLPHAAIVLSFMYFVFYAIDRVNSAMAFINNNITKALLVILCVIAIAEAVMLIRDDRRRTRLREKKRRGQAVSKKSAPARRANTVKRAA